MEIDLDAAPLSPRCQGLVALAGMLAGLPAQERATLALDYSHLPEVPEVLWRSLAQLGSKLRIDVGLCPSKSEEHDWEGSAGKAGLLSLPDTVEVRLRGDPSRIPDHPLQRLL